MLCCFKVRPTKSRPANTGAAQKPPCRTAFAHRHSWPSGLARKARRPHPPPCGGWGFFCFNIPKNIPQPQMLCCLSLASATPPTTNALLLARCFSNAPNNICFVASRRASAHPTRRPWRRVVFSFINVFIACVGCPWGVHGCAILAQRTATVPDGLISAFGLRVYIVACARFASIKIFPIFALWKYLSL